MVAGLNNDYKKPKCLACGQEYDPEKITMGTLPDLIFKGVVDVDSVYRNTDIFSEKEPKSFHRFLDANNLNNKLVELSIRVLEDK